LEETISYCPLRGEPMELYLDQFGSLLSGLDSVGDVVVSLHRSSGTGLRSVSLLDLEDEGATIDPEVPKIVATAKQRFAPAKVVAKVTSVVGAAPVIEHSKVLESADGEKTEAVATVHQEGRVDAAMILMGDESRDGGQLHFEELGGIILPRSLDF